MKRTGSLFSKIVDFKNLLSAFKSALKGKRKNPEAQKFYLNAEYQILELKAELLSEIYQMQPYITFTIRDPKERKIAAPHFRDHLVAHAIHQVIDPFLDKKLIAHSYASRVGKGVHSAIYQTQQGARQFRYFLKLDIQKYFASIDHFILKKQLSSSFKDPVLLRLLDRILASPIPYYPQGKGLALGHLLSQSFANLYLSPLDYWIKHTLKIPGYVRYMDDFLLLSSEISELQDVRQKLPCYLQETLKLSLKPQNNILSPTSEGIPFLGFLIFPSLIRLRNQTKQRTQKGLKNLKKKYQRHEIQEEDLQQSLQGRVEHLKIAQTFRWREKVLVSYPFDV
jgi:RNA-directed DNA polymerase